MRLSRDQKNMLLDLANGPQLAGKWDFSRSWVPDQLKRRGLVRGCDHPTVIDRKLGIPAAAYELTDTGREVVTSLT